jgi:aminopeptidase N
MREGQAPIVRREDYQAPAFWIRDVELQFDLDAHKTIVINRMRVERNPALATQALALHGEGLTVLRVLADGQSVSFREDSGLLHLDDLPLDKASFQLEIRNTCAPIKNTELSGLYASGSGLFTQCEAEGFRRITYFLDRPDVMATYKVTLRADKKRYPVLLSNGNLVAQGDLDAGRHFATWHDPHPKPSYLFAVVAADLAAREQKIRSRAGREHTLQVWVRRSDLDRTDHAMRSLIASVAWDEATFALPLDLERFMIVAVDDFNMGAMENKGLNLFNARYVLASPHSATDTDFADVESVVAHEYFHNWTGNRVTCRDWFQLSLKEGLTVFRDQQFSMDMAAGAAAAAASVSARAVKRIDDVRRLRTLQFPEDAGPMAHPVRPDAYQAIDNFYTATVYEKGAELVRMMHTLVGNEGFARGMALYFKRHDGQAVTCDDFAQAIAQANPDSILSLHLEAFKRWYSQSGTPRLVARGRYDAPSRSYTLGLEQQCDATPGQVSKAPFVIPVLMGLLDRRGRALPLKSEGATEDPTHPAPTERLIVLTEHRSFHTFHDLDEEPVPSLLRGFSAPVSVVDQADDDALLTLLRHDSDAFNRWEAGQRLASLRLVRAHDALNEPLQVDLLDTAYLEALRDIIRHPTLDAGLKAMVLTLPSERWTAEGALSADPQRIHAAHERVRAELAARLHDDWVWALESHQVRDGYAPSPVQAGQRAMANLALDMVCLHATRTRDAVWQGRTYQRFKSATNMTDRLGALDALLNARSDLADAAVARFYTLCKDDSLMLDKWFEAQARASEHVASEGMAQDGTPGVFARCRALLSHPSFTLTNPNRARSLIFTWMARNPAAFHRRDAAGYVVWADLVLQLDATNPQLAARLARVMDRWRHLAEPFQSNAREALQRVAAKADLSADTREIIGKALDAAP